MMTYWGEVPQTLPGWKSPWVSVSGTPQSVTARQASVEVVDEAGQGALVGGGEAGESVGDQLLHLGWEEV